MELDDNLSTTSTSTDSTNCEEKSSTGSEPVRQNGVLSDLPSTSMAKKGKVQIYQHHNENNIEPQSVTFRNCSNEIAATIQRLAARKFATNVPTNIIKKTTESTTLPVKELRALHELVPSLQTYEVRNDPFLPLLNERHVKRPRVAYADGTEDIIPSGAKKRKCYRKSIPYHLLLAPIMNLDDHMLAYVSGNSRSNGSDHTENSDQKGNKLQDRDISSLSKSNDEMKKITNPLPTTSSTINVQNNDQNIKEINPTTSANSTASQIPRDPRLRLRTKINYSDTKRNKARKDQKGNQKAKSTIAGKK
ncbi:uncharacterized protein LOC131213311 [Anopheles bellator]|uniref:uncharacterized protein LOC131213311 n=1 Tax=Anopheles bellator TaxID=139047 RepID=UPI002647CFD6|nr:uncharacterized protein LOC131213311 [Anopheles bellator]